MRRAGIGLLFLFATHWVWSQIIAIDSLKKELREAVTNHDSIFIMIDLSEAYMDVEVEKGLEWTQAAIGLAGSVQDSVAEIQLKLILAQYHLLNSTLEQSEELCRELLSSHLQPHKRAELFFHLGKTLQLLGRHDSAILYFDKSSELNHVLGRSEKIHLNNAYKGESLNRTGELHKALDICTKSLSGIMPLNLKYEEAIILNFLGGINVSMGNMATATDNFFSALTIADSLNNERLRMEQLNEIGIIYAVQQEPQESISYFQKALESAARLKSHRDYIGTLSNLAYMHSVIQEYDQSIRHYNGALAYNAQFGDDCLHPFIYEGLARLYENLQQPDSVRKFFQLVLHDAKGCQLKEFEISALQGLGRYYLKQNSITRSIEYFHDSFQLASRNDFKPLLQIASQELSEAYKKQGNFREALKYYEIAEAMEDSIYSQQSKEEILKLTARYEFEKEKQALQAEQDQREIEHQAEIKRQLLAKNYMWVGLALTIILIGTLWWSYTGKQKSNLILSRLNREKNELIGVVAHDLRSPLSTILGFSQILREDHDLPEEENRQYLTRIYNSADRMKDMIEKVLDVNAIDSDVVKMDAKVVDIGRLLNEVLDSIQLRADQKRIELIRNYNEGIYFSSIDRNYGIQIFENLLSNAIKFSKKGEEVVTGIGFEGDKVQVSIKDHGPGISDQERKLLFKRFAKLSARPTSNESSVGLGLSIVKRYVGAMGGELNVQSDLGRGTTFKVSFWSTKAMVS